MAQVADVGVEPQRELRTGVELVVALLGGEVFKGAFVMANDEQLELSAEQGRRVLPLGTVQSIDVAGERWTVSQFSAAVDAWSRQLVEESIATPPPVLVGALSLVWAGAGPLALGDHKGFLAYSAIELALVGAGVAMVAQGETAQLIPLVFLDGIFHAWAIGDSVREATRRRRRLRARLALLPSGMMGGERELAPMVQLELRPSRGERQFITHGFASTSLPVAAPLQGGLTESVGFPY